MLLLGSFFPKKSIYSYISFSLLHGILSYIRFGCSILSLVIYSPYNFFTKRSTYSYTSCMLLHGILSYICFGCSILSLVIYSPYHFFTKKVHTVAQVVCSCVVFFRILASDVSSYLW